MTGAGRGDLASNFASDHLARFEKSLAGFLDLDKPGGKHARSFATGIARAQSGRLPDGQLSRSDVLGFSGDPDLDTPTVCAAILAWGGMRMDNRNRLSADHDWLSFADNIRRGAISRAEAFHQFQDLRRDKRLKGMGPAFFTKLIYFLSPRGGAAPPAHILDQWTGSSVNLLSGSDVVRMDIVTTCLWKQDGSRTIDTAHNVSDHNTALHYEAFCIKMDALVSIFSRSVDEIDCALMSEGSDISWREYLKTSRVHLA